MTDKDYIAISNTGKHITITMTPGMKHRVLGRDDRIRMFYSCGGVHLIPSAPPDGYKLRERKNVWTVSMASARDTEWPVHERSVRRWAHVQFGEDSTYVELPNPILNQIEPLKNPNEPAMRVEYINLAGDYFEVQVESEDHARFWKAYLRTLEKTEASYLFKTPDMIVAAITGACFGSLVALALSAAGVLS